VVPICPSVGNPAALALPGSLPIILAYSICSGVMPAELVAAAVDPVAAYQIPSTSSRISTESNPARKLRERQTVI